VLLVSQLRKDLVYEYVLLLYFTWVTNKLIINDGCYRQIMNASCFLFIVNLTFMELFSCLLFASRDPRSGQLNSLLVMKALCSSCVVVK
jgi:hypothetical protein